jgi:hypothetical protein
MLRHRVSVLQTIFPMLIWLIVDPVQSRHGEFCVMQVAIEHLPVRFPSRRSVRRSILLPSGGIGITRARWRLGVIAEGHGPSALGSIVVNSMMCRQ